ncbi:Rz1-like lysis system protein LysC [Erwiniaceae bacterium BAC15a-03b]|uniref:Rz1-like lysis system protein LysC n=1 Tax=Winslowiella arboricola TaxID=2978220 RepID=A0A9J6PPE6_9GAMM|nr:Rz1-like lysis system protein LysC [Winslowiella arboricola]MCU5775852.1 Rz1-like lysis system protein LysC [Winslowiella arboricola]MCU5779298.1 Rz1-like lysis system protein LysC [Winslowiella arboricola]
MLLSGCTSVRPSPAPQIIYVGCPRVTSCPIPGNELKTEGDLRADNRQLEIALLMCGLQVETIKTCQEQHDAKTGTTPQSVNRQRDDTGAQP